MHKLIRATLTGVVAVQMTVACHAEAGTDDLAAPIVAGPPTFAAAVLSTRGQIISQQPVDPPFDDPDHTIGKAWRADYQSASGIDGSRREVSGVFVVPPGTPPPGGWPVAAIAHGTTGIAVDCGPSADPKLLGFLSMVRDMTAHGYAVAFTDYEGLGAPGSHPYLEPRTAAVDMIDAVRALRNIVPDVSNRWLAVGNSQGGQAAWAAGEMAKSYGDQLDLVGVVALSPAANITPFARRSADQTLTHDQQALQAALVAGVERYDPALRARNLIDAAVRAHENDVFACHPTAASSAIPQPEVHLANPDDVTALRDALRRIALPQHELSAPLLVINGLADQIIPAPWVAAAISAGCEMGDAIQHVEVSGAGHGDLGARSYQLMYQWMDDRLASLPAPSNCGRAPEQMEANNA
ncbi:MAG: lipase family protein [Mycobacterium sp.]